MENWFFNLSFLSKKMDLIEGRKYYLEFQHNSKDVEKYSQIYKFIGSKILTYVGSNN